ncbi:MAG: cobalt transporter CbiM [Cyanobacteria bacterium J06629_19]
MHISEGFLPARVCIAGYGTTGLLTWYSLKQIDRQGNPNAKIPKASLLTAAFFVASSISIPIPPTSVHLLLNGLLGVVLGYFAVPAILIGLLFQAMFFGHGGLTTLGVNATMMGFPALLAYHVFRLRFALNSEKQQPASKSLWRIGTFAFLGGALGLALTALIFFVLMVTLVSADFDVQTEQAAVTYLTLAHLPLAIIEGAFTAMLAVFLQRVKPELLTGR